jgi:hypothetical protein
MSPANVDHTRCINGHIFCDNQIVNATLFEHLCDLYDEGGGDDMYAANLPYEDYGKPETYRRYGLGDDDRYEVPAEFCPVCQMKFVSPAELDKYIYRIHNLKQKEVIDEIRSKFDSYDEFVRFLNG